MSFTLQNCVDWVQNDVLKRTDMTQALLDAVVNFYVTLTRKIPFDELCYTSDEYNVVPGVVRYDLDNLTPPLNPPINSIASIRMTYGSSGNSVRLRRSSVRLYDAISYSNSMRSRPSTYARWGNAIELNPAPDNSQYTFRIRYYGQAIIAGSPGTTVCVIRDEWAELIKWELLYRAYYYLEQFDKASSLVTPSMMPRGPSPRRQVMFETGIIPRLWNDLLSTISAKENIDEDFSINPIVRDYNSR